MFTFRENFGIIIILMLSMISRKDHQPMSQIKDKSLYPSGDDKIEWVKSYMPVLGMIERDFAQSKPFAGKKISMSIHLEAKTAYLAHVLRAGGASVYVTGCM